MWKRDDATAKRPVRVVDQSASASETPMAREWRRSRPDSSPGRISHHILPASGTMVGICTTMVGLVKVTEGRVGPSAVDEWSACTALIFLLSAVLSYLSIRFTDRSILVRRLEAFADGLFMFGLLAISIVSLLFAYEVI